MRCSRRRQVGHVHLDLAFDWCVGGRRGRERELKIQKGIPEARGVHAPRQQLFAFERERFVSARELQPVLQSAVACLLPGDAPEATQFLPPAD